MLAASLIVPLVPLFVWEHSVQAIDGGPGWGFYLAVASVIVFIGAVISMGAPLWSRIEAIFTWEAEIVLPERQE